MNSLDIANKTIDELSQRLSEMVQKREEDQLLFANKNKEYEIQLIQIRDKIVQILKQLSCDGKVDSSLTAIEMLDMINEFIKTLNKDLNFAKLTMPKQNEKVDVEQQSDSSPSETPENDDSPKDSTDTTENTKRKNSRREGDEHSNHNAKRKSHLEEGQVYEEIKVFPDGIQMQDILNGDYEIIKSVEQEKTSIIPAKTKVTKYILYTLKDRKTGKILFAKVPKSALKGSNFMPDFVAWLIMMRYVCHSTWECLEQRLHNMKFSMSSKCIGALINKYAHSLFFRNIDTVLKIAVHKAIYIIMDESFVKVLTEIIRPNNKFIKEFWIWGQFAVIESLIWFHSEKGARTDEVGYAILEDMKCIVQTDGKSCYRHVEEKYADIIRISCIQHTKRKFLSLQDPRSVEMVNYFNQLYHADHETRKMAEDDAKIGKIWSEQELVEYRYKKVTPILETIEMRLPQILSEVEKGSELYKAANYAMNEMKGIKAIFSQNILCFLDTNKIEILNRAFSYIRRTSLFFGSEDAGENACILISLTVNCILHDVDPLEYFTFLLNKMKIMQDGIIKDENSALYEEYRNLLPDRFKMYYQKPEREEHRLTEKIITPKKSTRKAYKKHYSKLDSLQENTTGSKNHPTDISKTPPMNLKVFSHGISPVTLLGVPPGDSLGTPPGG